MEMKISIYGMKKEPYLIRLIIELFKKSCELIKVS